MEIREGAVECRPAEKSEISFGKHNDFQPYFN
jgi:hypothetical protein